MVVQGSGAVERSYDSFQSLRLSELVRYWWLLARRGGPVRSISLRARSLIRLLDRVCRKLLLRAALKWVYWKGSDSAQPDPHLEAPTTDDAAPRPPRTYKTDSGLTVVEKRRVALEPDIEPSDVPDHVETNPDRCARVNSFWHKIIGKSILWSAAGRIPKIDARDLTARLLSSPALRAIVSGSADPGLDLLAVIDLGSDSSDGDWRVLTYRWLRSHADPVTLESVVSSELLNESAVTRRAMPLRLIPHLAGVFSDVHARSILAKLLTIVERPVDPYQASGDVLLARSGIVSLLRQRPELEGVALEKLGATQMGDNNDRIPTAASLLAFSLRERGLPAAITLADVAKRAQLTSKAVEALSRAADSPLRLSTSRNPPAAEDLPFAPGPFVRRLMCWAGVALLTTLGAIVLRDRLPLVQPLEIPIAAAIATLALLATVQVFAGNLSGARLPSTIARYTSQSWQLDLAYAASVAMIGLAIWQPSQPAHGPWTLIRNWASNSALVIWTFALLIALLAVFRRVDASRAAAGFVIAQKRRARSTGRRVGRYQARAIEMTSLIESCAAIEIQPSAIAGAWDRSLNATRRGIVLPSRRGLRRILASGPVRQGLRLRITAGLATTVNRYDTIAHAVPLRDQSVDTRWLRNTRNRIEIRRIHHIDDISSGAIALSKLSADLVASGDLGTAHQVAQTLTKFVNYHMSWTRSRRKAELRRWESRERLKAKRNNVLSMRESVLLSAAQSARDDSRVAPINPLLRDVLQITIRSAVAASGPAVGVPEYVVRSLLAHSTHTELAVSMTTFAIPVDEVDSVTKLMSAIRILRLAGLQSLEQQELIAFKLILDRIVEMAAEETFVTHLYDVVCDLTAYACRYGSDLALAGCACLEKLLALPSSNGEGDAKTRGAVQFWRVGAAALAVGAVSTAFHIARLVHQRNWAAYMVAASKNPDHLGVLASRSDLFGGYLGETPRDALATFGQLLEAYPGDGSTSL